MDNMSLEEQMSLFAIDERFQSLGTMVRKRTEFICDHLRSLQSCIDKLEARVKKLEADTNIKSTD